MIMSNFCPKCGAERENNHKFCSTCGTVLDIVGEGGAIEGSKDSPRKTKFTKKALVITLSSLVVLGGTSVAAVSFIQAENAKVAAAAAAARFKAKQDDVANVISGALKKCGVIDLGPLSGYEVAYNSLSIDGFGEDDYWGASYSDITCVLTKLQMPKSTEARWGNTRALDGQLNDSWEGPDGDWSIEIFWSYHPDSGPSVFLELSSKYLEGYKESASTGSESS